MLTLLMTQSKKKKMKKEHWVTTKGESKTNESLEVLWHKKFWPSCLMTLTEVLGEGGWV